MNFVYSRHSLKGKDEFLQRLFEMLPATTSWMLILALLVLPFFLPRAFSIVVIIFLLAWIIRLFYLTILLFFSYARVSIEKHTNWLARVHGMDRLESYLEELEKGRGSQDWQSRISLWSHRRDLRKLKKCGNLPPLSLQIHHLVVIPVVKESSVVVEANVASIAQNKFLARQILIVIALEARANPTIKEGVYQIADQYRSEFLDFLVVEHPEGLSNEARVKGANSSYAAKTAAQYFMKKKIPFPHVIVSCFDADTVVSPDYFACLTYSFMACPDRYHASFQPIPVFHNNIWEVPGFARVVETGSSFFQLVEITDPEKLVTFSSHSMSFKALVEVGYWPSDMISDDSGIFWKSYLHFEGDYRVIPLPITLSMDVVDAGSWWRTVVSLYKQKRRWAWGVENFPLVMRGFLQSKKIPLYDKIRLGFKLFESHITWAVLPFFLTFVGWLPALCTGHEFSNTVLYYSANRFTQTIFSLSSFALLGTVILSIWLLPKKKKKYSIFWSLVHGLEWLLVPLILVFLSGMPALDAQTRLMLNQRMEFWVSDKRRIKHS